MAYIPKSQVKIIQVKGELIGRRSRIPYYGSAIHTSDDTFYAGTNRVVLGEELVRDENKEEKKENTVTGLGPNDKFFSSGYDTRKFNNRQPNIKDHLKGKRKMSPSKPYPKQQHYKEGFFKRYFGKRFNGDSYIEISEKTYDDITSRKGYHDYNLYTVDSLTWFLTGDVHKKNSISLKRAQRSHPHILYLFPVINEYQLPDTNIQENLHTSGGELFYSDGTSYVGGYHIHPVKGPMVGAFHSSSPHDTLYYFNQLPQLPNQSYEDFLSNYMQMDCYKCVQVNKYTDPQIFSSKRSSLLGCLEDQYTSVEEASDNCPAIEAIIDNIDRPPMVENSENSNTSAFDTTRPNQLLDNNETPLIYVDDVVGGNEPDVGDTRPEIPQYLQSYSCFVPNTMVIMADGSEKTISSIKIGEKVKSEKGESTVLDIQIHKGEFKVYSINDSKPFVTPEHPFKTIDGWKAIDPITTLEKHQISSTTLNINDIIIKANGQEIVTKIEINKTKYPKVYNLMLDNEHVYYANGYLVHNEKINTY